MVVPPRSGLSGRLLVLRFVLGDTVTLPGSCPARPPGRSLPLWPGELAAPGWMRPGCRPRGDAEGRGVAPSIASCSVRGAGLCPHCCWRAPPTPVSAVDSKCTEQSLRQAGGCQRQAGSVCLPGGWFSATHSWAGLEHRPFVPQGRARAAAGGQGQLAGGVLPAPESPKKPSSWC